MTLRAITDCGRMDRALDLRWILVSVTGEAQRGDRGCGQLDPRDIAIDAHFVARQATHGNRRVDSFALRLVLMAFKALR